MFLGVLHHFVLAKLATSSIRVRVAPLIAYLLRVTVLFHFI